jgi:[protein-PII] uridylyltransferase
MAIEPHTSRPETRGATPGAARSRVATLLATAREEYAVDARAGRAGRLVQARYAAVLDEIIRQLVAEWEGSAPFVVCAVGGYGRRTLCLHSDIDLLIVFDGRIGAAEERLLNGLLQPLWDLRLTVGHHVRELADLGTDDDRNPEFLLALCDLRLLVGDVRVFDEVIGVTARANPAGAPALVEALLTLTDARYADFNDTLYQLEPDVKKAPGGLRDISAVRLLATLARDAFAAAGPASIDRLSEAEEFLLRVRSILHVDARRDANVLTHEEQERVAEALGLPGQDPRQRVEALMGAYFRHARRVVGALQTARTVVAPSTPHPPVGPLTDTLVMAPDGVAFADDARAATQPAVWLEAFAVALRIGARVSNRVLACIQENVGRYTADYFMASDEVRRRLLGMLHPERGLSACLSAMLDCGLLGTLFPEIERIHGRVIRDFYHKYTVDEHTLLAIRHLEAMRHPSSAGRARFASILNEVHAPELLVLALLYHDTGKWREGDHAQESARLAGAMLERLRLSDAARATVEFLITRHLAMSTVMFRRDVSDPDTIAELAALAGTEERLKMLTLVTLVDIDAVAPGTLTPWKEDLLWRLYVEAYNDLTHGYADELIRPDQADRALVMAECPDDITDAELSRFLDGLPARYLNVFGLSAIYRHVRLARDLKADALRLALEKHDDVWELTVAALDKPFLFSNIAGVLASFGMNIHRGQAMTTPDQLALDVFEFSDDEGFLRENAGARDEVARVLRGVIGGGIDIRERLRGRERSVMHRRRRDVDVAIQIDNETSRRYTVVEIVTGDAPGLLYRISRAISDQGCDVDLVLISTEGHKAIDVLHVTKQGRKLDAPVQFALRQELVRTLEATHETD